jgi:hypothetical protein
MSEDNKIDWTSQLKNDLSRINTYIKQTRTQVEEGIDKLRLLEQERHDIVTKCLGECDE